MAVGLRGATGVAGVEDAAQRALTKLDHVLPDRLRRQIGAAAA